MGRNRATRCQQARDELIRLNKLKGEKELVLQPTAPKRPRRTESGVIVEGIDNCLSSSPSVVHLYLGIILSAL